MGECGICGVEIDGNTIDHRVHNEWCAKVDRIVEQAKDGPEISPDMGTAHQFAEALNRLGTQFDSCGCDSDGE